MWKDLEKGFQAAVEEAWDTFVSGNFPIGAAILDETGNVAAVGRNQIFVDCGGPIALHQLAHAEANAILRLSETEHPNIRKYTLYATTEPCPFCFGAIAMGSIKHVKYACRDPWAGATNLNNASPYMVQKRIAVEGPYPEPEFVMLTLNVCCEMEKFSHINNRVLDAVYGMSQSAVAVGKSFYDNGIIKGFMDSNTRINEVYDYSVKEFNTTKGV